MGSLSLIFPCSIFDCAFCSASYRFGNCIWPIKQLLFDPVMQGKLALVFPGAVLQAVVWGMEIVLSQMGWALAQWCDALESQGLHRCGVVLRHKQT